MRRYLITLDSEDREEYALLYADWLIMQEGNYALTDPDSTEAQSLRDRICAYNNFHAQICNQLIDEGHIDEDDAPDVVIYSDGRVYYDEQD